MRMKLSAYHPKKNFEKMPIFQEIYRLGARNVIRSARRLSATTGAFSTVCCRPTAPKALASRRMPALVTSAVSVSKLQTQTPSIISRRELSTSCKLNSVAIQEPAPDFEGMAVIDGQFKDIKLSDYKGKYLVLFFYPLDFTFVCPTEIIAYSDRADEFRAINTEVVAASIDSHFSHLAWINTPRKQGGLGEMKIPLLSDMKKQIAEDYGVLLKDAGIALRGLFLIDPEGVVRHMSINDLPVGRSVDETLRLVKAFQFVAEHGEVCPAGWTPESETIKPDPEGSKSYFEKVN